MRMRTQSDSSSASSSTVAWLYASAIVNHLLWSTLAVSSRYLQVYATPLAFHGMAILTVCKAVSAMLLLFVASCCSMFSSRDTATTTTTTTPNGHPMTAPQRTRLFFALAFGSTAACRACFNIISMKYTLSYNINVINGMTPLVVSIADALILETQLPVLLWPSVLVSFVGCALIALAQSPLFVKSSSSSYVFTHRDAIGCVLQFVSVLFSSLARLLMKRTEHILTRDEMVQSNNLFNTLIPLTYTLLVPDARSQWKAFQETSVQSIVALLSIAVLVYTVGSTGQMSLVRKMGAGVYSSFSAIRVLGSVLFSSLFLGEPVQNWLEWLGLLVATLTMTLYTIASSVDSTSACLRSKNSLGEDDASNDEEEGVAMSPQKNWISIPTSDVVDEEVEDESGIQKESNVGLSSKSFDGISRATALSLHAASSQL